MVLKQKSEPKKQWTQQIRKRAKKAKLKGQKLSLRSVDSNKLTKIRPKKRKSEPENAVDTVDKKKA